MEEDMAEDIGEQEPERNAEQAAMELTELAIQMEAEGEPAPEPEETAEEAARRKAVELTAQLGPYVEALLMEGSSTLEGVYASIQKNSLFSSVTLGELNGALLRMCADSSSRVYRPVEGTFSVLSSRRAAIISTTHGPRVVHDPALEEQLPMVSGRSRLQVKTAEVIEEFVDASSAKTMQMLKRSQQWHLCHVPRRGQTASSDDLKELVVLVKKRQRVRDDRSQHATRRQRSLAHLSTAASIEARRYLPIEVEEVRHGFVLESQAEAAAREEMVTVMNRVALSVSDSVHSFARLDRDRIVRLLRQQMRPLSNS